MSATTTIYELKSAGAVLGAVAMYVDDEREVMDYYVCTYDKDGEGGTTGWEQNREIGAGAKWGMLDDPPMTLGKQVLPKGIPEPPSADEVLGA